MTDNNLIIIFIPSENVRKLYLIVNVFFVPVETVYPRAPVLQWRVNKKHREFKAVRLLLDRPKVGFQLTQVESTAE